MEQRQPFQQMALKQLDIHMQKNKNKNKKNLNTEITPFTKINSKQITDLNIETKSVKLLEENIGVNPHDFGLGNSFLDLAPKAQEKLGKLDFMKILETFVLQSTPKESEKTTDKMEENICKSYI